MAAWRSRLLRSVVRPQALDSAAAGANVNAAHVCLALATAVVFFCCHRAPAPPSLSPAAFASHEDEAAPLAVVRVVARVLGPVGGSGLLVLLVFFLFLFLFLLVFVFVLVFVGLRDSPCCRPCQPDEGGWKSFLVRECGCGCSC